MTDTVYGVFCSRNGGPRTLFTSGGRGKSPYYGKLSTAQSVATWMENNGNYGINKHNGYEFTVMAIVGEWEDIE